MGIDKATIVWRGETLAVRAARVLCEVCDPVFEVGTGATALRVVQEEPPGAGPVAAVLRGVDALGAGAGAARGVLVLACDMPFVEPPLLELLTQQPGDSTVIPVRAGRPQYLCARYGPAWLERARRAGAVSFKGVVTDDCEYLADTEWQRVAAMNALDDVDTPEDRARSIGS